MGHLFLLSFSICRTLAESGHDFEKKKSLEKKSFKRALIAKEFLGQGPSVPRRVAAQVCFICFCDLPLS
jgi:hypothetical protein